jgi:hypothetical protein
MRNLASILLVLLLTIPSSPIFSQSRVLEKKQVALWFGIRDITRDSLANTGDLDFLNYLHSSEDMSEYQYLGVSAHLWFRGNWEADIKVAMYDDFAPNNLNIKAIWLPMKNLGFTAGIYTYPQLMNEFNMFHRLTDVGFFGDTDSNFRQRRVQESGLTAGLVIPFSYRWLHASAYLNGGISTLSPFTEKVTQKMINGNFKREIRYSTNHSPALFFFPEVELWADCFTIGNSKAGIRLRTSWYTVSRSVGYSRVVYEWIYENPVRTEVDNPAHHFSKIEFDAGFYLTW